MKIIVFCAYFYPHKGGVENYVHELFSGLDKFGDIEVTIVTSNTENTLPYEYKDGLAIHRLACWHLLSETYPVIKFSGRRELRKLDNKNNKDDTHSKDDKDSKDDKGYDYVITNTRFFNTTLLGYSFAKRNNIPLIHIEHGTCHSMLTNPFVRMINESYDHTIGKHIIKNADKVVCVSIAAQEFVNHLYKRKSSIIYNSIDTAKFKKMSLKDQAQLKKKLGIKDEQVITYAGRLIHAKGVHDLLTAVEDMDDVKILILGDGNYSPELKRRFSGKKYIYLGKYDSKILIRHLSITDIFVNPSYSEGLPTTVLEAGAMGLPIIATDVGGTREIIKNEENGFLIRPKDVKTLRDKINLLIDDKRLCKRFSINIRNDMVSRFDWSIARKRLMDILKNNIKII